MDNNLALGFRFYPTEEELISFYLRNKLEGLRPDLERVIPVLDIYEMDPWHLPQFCGERCRGDPEQWFFFLPRQEREARGGRNSRTTGSGYWKSVGSPGYAYSSENRIIGIKKTMVFYKGKAPCGRKTKWKMNEYKAILGEASSSTGATPNPIVSKNPRKNSVLYHFLKPIGSLSKNGASEVLFQWEIMYGSGCLRAFDRRPAGAMTSEMAMQVPQAVSGAGMTSGSGESMTTTSHHQRSHPKIEKSCSQDISFSGGDDAHPPETSESTFWEISDDALQSLLEWKNSNWD